MRVVIVDPSYASPMGHHQELNSTLLMALSAAGHTSEVWADATVPPTSGVRQVSFGCGYIDQRHWADLAGSLHLATRLRRQFEVATAADGASGRPAPDAWLAHSLLPFQLIALAQLLQHQPPALVLLSLMFAPGETLGGSTGPAAKQRQQQASLTMRTALQALAQAARQGKHRLIVGSSSRQTLALHEPLLQAAGLEQLELHPAVVGAGCRIPPAAHEQEPTVLLHWGDFKADKGRQEALAVVQAQLQRSATGTPPAWRLLFHGHSQEPLAPDESALLQKAQQLLGDRFVWLDEYVPTDRMQQWLASCDLALLAYSPLTYATRSSGVLWCYAAARHGCSRSATVLGYSGHWLQREGQALGMAWVTAPSFLEPGDGSGWLRAVEQAMVRANQAEPIWTSDATRVLGQSFSDWILQKLATPLR